MVWEAMKGKMSTRAFVTTMSISVTVLIFVFGGIFFMQFRTYDDVHSVDTRLAVLEAKDDDRPRRVMGSVR